MSGTLVASGGFVRFNMRKNGAVARKAISPFAVPDMPRKPSHTVVNTIPGPLASY